MNFPYEGGVTGYFGRNLTADDLKAVRDILVHEKIDILTTRAFKRDTDQRLIITVGSISEQGTKKEQKFGSYCYDIIYGEFGPYLEECNYYLNHALRYCANEKQEAMIKKYIEHFYTGDVEAHKEAQRIWVKD